MDVGGPGAEQAKSGLALSHDGLSGLHLGENQEITAVPNTACVTHASPTTRAAARRFSTCTSATGIVRRTDVRMIGARAAGVALAPNTVTCVAPTIPVALV